MTNLMFRVVNALGVGRLGTRLPLLFLCIVLTTVSCATPKEKTRLSVYNKPAGASGEEVAGTPAGPATEPSSSKLPEAGTSMTLIPPISGSFAVNKNLPDLKNRFSPTEEVTVSVDTIQLSDFINYIFKDLLNVNYILDSKVPAQEKLSLNLQDRVTKQKLYGIVSDILASYNTIVREKGGVYYIVAGTPQQSIDLGIGSAYSDVPETTGQVRQLVPIRYAPLGTLAQMLASTQGIQVNSMQSENILVLQGTRENVLQALQLVDAIDRPVMRGKFGVMFKIAYWDSKDFVPKLKDILSQEGIPVSTNATEGGLRLIPIDRWRIILAFAAQKEWIDRLTYWVKTLDIPEEKDDNQFFIYFPDNSRAKDLGDTLTNIMGLSNAKQKTVEKTNKSDLTKQGAQMRQPAMRSPAATETSSVNVASETSSGAISSNMASIADRVSVTVDENRNALVIYTTPMYYKSIVSLLKQIDLMPPQVLLEATVAEVTLTGSLAYGLEWYIQHSGFDLTGSLNILQKTIGAGGLDYSLVNTANTFKLLINALATENKIKVLSSPRLTVRDGKSASIIVGTEVPVVTGEVSTTPTATTTGVVRAIQYRVTGITLQVTPTVHSRGVMTLQIIQGVSEPASNATSGIDSPMILNRNITTEVVAADGQTVMLGGLIKENDSQTLTRVPWISDIPILGNLFKNTSKGNNRTELVIMITPRIIRSPEQIEDMRSVILHNFEEITIEDSKQDGTVTHYDEN
ncbi:MAG: hypothetical protein HY881_12110 [Deltaproteobacteria bacterium]|nr:hypothetical protein [Deltaproteobacteria bacterium]